MFPLFWHCVHDQWASFDRLSPDRFLMFQLRCHNLYQIQLMIANFGSWNIARIIESCINQSCIVFTFHVPLFPTLIKQACFQTLSKIWVFVYPLNTDSSNCCPFLRHFPRVLDYMMHYYFRTWIWTVAITLVLSSLVHSSLKVHFSHGWSSLFIITWGIALFTNTVFLAVVLLDHIQHAYIKGRSTQGVWYGACADAFSFGD